MNVETKYMLGTEGTPDYLVIAEDEGLRLGIKGLMQEGPSATLLLGVRVRSTAISGNDVPDNKVFSDTWPVPFEKIDASRASVEIVNLVSCTYLQFETLVAAAKKARFASKAFDYFEGLDIKMAVAREDVIEHLHKQWFDEALTNINSETPALLFSNYVPVSKMVSALKNELTVTQKGVTVDGVVKAWPDEVAQKKPASKKKAIKGADGSGGNSQPMGSNVVALNPPTATKPKTKPKAKTKAKPKKSSPKKTPPKK